MAGSGTLRPMRAGGDCHESERRPVLYLNTPTAPPLGADTWIHAEIMRRIDRAAWAPIAAHAFGPADDPTPTHRVLGAIPDLELVRANLGPELSGRSTLGKVRAPRRDDPGAVDRRPARAC